MNLPDTFRGDQDLFEGDRTLTLHGLPAGARVTRARITLKPVKNPAAGAVLFQETFTFDQTAQNGELLAGDWGATRIPETAGQFVEVDFHARRTLVNITGSGGNANLLVDMGGVYLEVADDGTFKPNHALQVNLSTTPVNLPGLTVNRFKFQSSTAGATLNVSKVTIRAVPMNITVRLGQLPPFWTRLGDLATSDTSPDFAAVLNALLLTAQPQDGFYAVPFTIHSDTLARLDVDVSIDFQIDQPVLPPHLPEATLPYGLSTLPGFDDSFTTVRLPRNALPVTGQSGAQVRGEFQSTRVAQGPVGDDPPSEPVPVSPDCSLAQLFRSDVEIQMTGIDLPLDKTKPDQAGLNVSIQADDNGKPSGTTLDTAELRVDKPLPGQPAWGTTTLPIPFRVEANKYYWLILQSKIGQACWLATPGSAQAPAVMDTPLQCSHDGGLSWRQATTGDVLVPMAALMRLRHQPPEFKIPVQLQIGRGKDAVRRKLDEYAPLGRVEFKFDFAQKLDEYMRRPGSAAPCGGGELIINGSFDQPPYDDATERLFGKEPEFKSAAGITGQVDLRHGVDLTIERFIVLSANNASTSPSWRVPPTRIDCAGTDPARTSLGEIINAINGAVGHNLASKTDKGELHLFSGASATDIVTLYPWCSGKTPIAWQSQGQITRSKKPTGIGANLVALPIIPNAAGCLDNPVPPIESSEVVELSQRVRIVGECTYTLSFIYSDNDFGALGSRGTILQPGRWQIDWLDNSGQVIDTVGSTLATSSSQKSIYVPDGQDYEEYKTIVTAASDAVEAVLQFIQPPRGILGIDKVSFRHVSELLTNADLQVWQSDSKATVSLPLGWTTTGQIEIDNTSIANRAVTKLYGNGPDATVLSQTVDVLSGEPYVLQISAAPLSEHPKDSNAVPMEQRARLELHWTGNGTLGPTVVLPLDGQDFAVHNWSGNAPAGAKQAEIRIIQPPNARSLGIQWVSLERVDSVSVPLVFLSEAPGQLTISNMHVVYDVPQPPKSTASQSAPQQAAASTLRAFRATAPSVSMPAIVETPPPPVAPEPLIEDRIGLVASPTSKPSPLAGRPVTLIVGIGPRIAQALKRRRPPIMTISELAEIDPGIRMTQITPKQLLKIKTTAEMVMDIGSPDTRFTPVANESLASLLATPPAELAQRASVNITDADQLLRRLRALQLLLNRDALRSLTLSDLMPVDS